MWLLDENLPLKLSELLTINKIPNDTVVNRGWSNFTNGELLKLAVENNFTVILTKDKLFAEAAAKSIKKYPGCAIVRVMLPQMKEKEYLQLFQETLEKNPIAPVPGDMIQWPDPK